MHVEVDTLLRDRGEHDLGERQLFGHWLWYAVECYPAVVGHETPDYRPKLKAAIERSKCHGERLRKEFGEHRLGTNFCVFVGVLEENPTIYLSSRTVRLDMLVQDGIRRLKVRVICRGRLAVFAADALKLGHRVGVTGKLWERFGERRMRALYATSISAPLPLLPDENPEYVRVRVDVFSRVQKLMRGEKVPDVPELRREFAASHPNGEDAENHDKRT